MLKNTFKAINLGNGGSSHSNAQSVKNSAANIGNKNGNECSNVDD
jgi:hypothetical protein